MVRSIHRKKGDENDAEGDNPFWDGPRVGKERRQKGEREKGGEGRVRADRECKGDKTVDCESDVWVDTDLEEDAYMQVSRNGTACG